MSLLDFHIADPIADRASLIQINIEYMEWVAAGIQTSCGISIVAVSGQLIPDYVENALDKICFEKPPHGVFYLVKQYDAVVGMVGLRSLSQDVAEIKRLYVRHAFRGQQLGKQLLNKIVIDAKNFGYARVRLDSAPFMITAQKLYRSSGFLDRAPYPGTEVPEVLHARWHFMELNLLADK
ncbi:GNAT family N-acetyltransferase [Undibacterium sp. SXout11W]|uniref:GNAT family N-acetyltransferase n=1 Tax=Undibacterium sp. SXout11W TaxID=3413050 RepID=UPI003BF11187